MVVLVAAKFSTKVSVQVLVTTTPYIVLDDIDRATSVSLTVFSAIVPVIKSEITVAPYVAPTAVPVMLEPVCTNVTVSPEGNQFVLTVVHVPVRANAGVGVGAVFCPCWLTVTVWPAMLNNPVLEAPLFAATPNVTDPLPLRVALAVRNPVLLAAVHGHTLARVTVTVYTPSPDPTLNAAGDTVAGHESGFGDGGVSGFPVVIPPTTPLQPGSVLSDVQLTSTGPISFTPSEPAIVTGLLASSADQVPLRVSAPA